MEDCVSRQEEAFQVLEATKAVGAAESMHIADRVLALVLFEV